MSYGDSFGRSTLEELDPEVYELCKEEKKRQCRGLEMIASENFTSKAVCQVSSFCFLGYTVEY
jgi:glycine hydroxymethyltransferase